MTHLRENIFITFAVSAAVVFTAFVAFAPLALPFDPNVTNLAHSLCPPGEDGYMLGSDALGRDVLARTLAGGTESVFTAFVVVLLSFAIGCAVGIVQGFAGGAVDAVLSRVVSMFLAFPSLVLSIAIAAVLGQGVQNMVIAIVAVYWTQFARLARSLTVQLQSVPFVQSARVCGAGTGALMWKYILPNMVGPLIVMTMVSIGDVVLTMAGLSFLGLGPARPTNEWGAMMAEARSDFQVAPWCIAVPGVALFLAVTVYNLLGDALRDVLDARSQGGNDSGDKQRAKTRKGNKMNARLKNGLSAGIAACAVAALCHTGCAAGGQDAQNALAEGSAKVLYAGSDAYFYAESLDPAHSWDGWEMQYYGITENLVHLTDSFEVEPWLAQSVENVDDTTWEITLRDGVQFTNGAPMTGEAVKACLERTYAENARAQETLPMASIEADGQTVTFTTAKPVAAFENCLCDPIFSIYYVGDDVEDYATGTPCTGPYVPSEFVADPDYSCVLVPNENYWNGTPKLDEVHLTTYFDPDAMTMAMQGGELDILAMPPQTAYTLMEGDGTHVKLSQTSTRADFVRFNLNHDIVSNVAVRQAVAFCIDREGFADVICGGTEVPSYGVYSAQLPYGGTTGLDPVVTSCDVDEAKAVLDEAGIVDADGDGIRELNGAPLEITLQNCTSYERFVRLADDLQSKLAEAGIKLNIVEVDYFLQDMDTYKTDDPDMTIESMGMAPTGDAGYFATMGFASNGTGNYGGYSNAKVDALVEELSETFDEAEREGVIKQIEQEILNDCPYIFFSNSTTNYLADAKVSGVAVAPSEYYFLTVDTDIDR